MRRLLVVLFVHVCSIAHAQMKPMNRPAWLGFAVDSGPSLVVGRVAPESPAARAGLVAGDVIVRIGGAFASRSLLERTSSQMRSGDTVRLQVQRGTMMLPVTLIAREAEPFRFEQRVAQFQMEFGQTVRRLLDTARTQASGPGLYYEGKDSTLVFRNPARGTRISIDSLVQSARMREDSSVTFATAMPARGIAGADVSAIEPPLTDYLGVQSGLLVLHVVPQGSASRGGMRAGDVIVRIAGSSETSVAAFRRAVMMSSRTQLSIIRNRMPLQLTIVR